MGTLSLKMGRDGQWGCGLKVVSGGEGVATVTVQRARRRAGVRASVLTCTGESPLPIAVKPVFFPWKNRGQ